MTGNQLTYWANIERERANRAAEALDARRIAVQKYGADLNYAASIYGANLQYQQAMKNLASQEKRAENELNYRYDSMWFNKYGFAGLYGESAYNKTKGYAEDALVSAENIAKSAIDWIKTSGSQFNWKELHGAGGYVRNSTNNSKAW